MKKLFSLILVLCFSVNVMAASTSGLERAMDDYQYALTVEWDQKDQAVYQAKTDAFFAEMAKMIADEGLTKEQILSVAEKKMQNKAQLEALKLKLQLAGKASNSQELAGILQSSVKDMYSRGASWNGDVLPMVGIGLLVAAVIGYAVWFSATHECVAYEDRWECNTNNYCDDYGYCSGTESCGWEPYCTQYVKK
ncbi:MAG: hypothetical protein ACJ76H_07940 [Bacteriovoracaceae bacterium]